VGERYLAIVNPAARGGRARELVGPALDPLRSAGLDVSVRETSGPGRAAELVRSLWREGHRNFISVGGDGTSFEIVNGLFPLAAEERAKLGFLPLGTGNSFLRHYTEGGARSASAALIAGRSRPCDVLRLHHKGGVLHYINLLSIGFTADVAATRQRRFSGWGEAGYQAAIFICLARFRRRPFPLSMDGKPEIDRRPCLFLTFNNTKFTGGTMMIAPTAEADDGLIEYVRWGPIGRIGLMRNLPRLYDGSHIEHPLAEVHRTRRIDFHLEEAVDVMVDGEVLRLKCQGLDVLPRALDIVV
jgi:diacylglycerol kinase family enzyme